MAPQRFRQLDQRYDLLREIGYGYFSTVYLAKDQTTGELVAIKQLNLYGLHPALRHAAQRLFSHEASILAHIHHPQVPRIHGMGTHGQRPYLVLDYIEAETLEAYLTRRGGSLSIEETCTIGILLCSVVSYLHKQHSLLHLDLKPSNILRTADGHMYVIDFASACFCRMEGYTTPTFGTERYSAPELFLDDEGKTYPTCQSDIYSLGVILHHLHTGRLPQSPLIEEPLPWSSAPVRSYVSQQARFLRVTDAMRSPNPRQRPASVEAVAQALSECDVTTHTLFH
jgi:serine/threonine protein kinase